MEKTVTLTVKVTGRDEEACDAILDMLVDDIRDSVDIFVELAPAPDDETGRSIIDEHGDFQAEVEVQQ